MSDAAGSRTRGLRARAVAVFALSGAVALGLEAAVFRACGLLFGATHAAAGAVLACFMAGLALGALLAGRLAERLARPARGYAACELAVGLWALAAPWAFVRSEALAARASGAGPRVALAFALLAPATVAMGATTPLLAQAVVRSRASLRAGLGGLYAANLLGGVAGALLVGFWLLPALGLAATLRAAGLAALGVSALAAVSLRGAGAFVHERDEPAGHAPRAEAGEALAPVVLALVGAVSFALQVAQQRVLALLLGSAAYTFALVTAATLAGLGLGGARASRERDDEPDGSDDEAARRAKVLGLDALWSRAAGRLLALAIWVFLSVLLVRAAPPYLRASALAGPGAARAARLLVATLAVTPPAYLVGALFPALASRVRGGGAGLAAARASLASTAGNVAGALGAGFVLVPAVGTQRALLACAAAALGLALACAARAGLARLRAVGVAAALCVAFASATDRAWDPAALSAATYRVAAYRAARDERDEGPCGPARRLARHRVRFARDGALGTVVVLAHEATAGAPCGLLSLRVDGKAEGSAFVAAALPERLDERTELLPVGDLPSEVLAGLVPVAARGAARTARVFLVGWGTGLSARALLDAGAARVVAAELEPAVLAAAEHFDAAALRDPRVTLVRDDARMALRREHAAGAPRYDVLVSHPSNPWVTGAAALFSREYFTLLRARLAPGGVALAWVQLYETDAAAVRSLVRTFREVFPTSHGFVPGPSGRDLFLLGAADDAALPATREGLAERFARWRAGPGAGPGANAERALARLGLAGDDGRGLRALHRADPAALARYSAGAERVVDDNAALEYRVAARLLAGASEPVEALLAGLP